MGKFKPWQVKLVSNICALFGQSKKLASGQKRFDGINVWEKSSSMSKARYDYQFDKRLSVPEYTTYGGTFAWAKASVKATSKCMKNASLNHDSMLIDFYSSVYNQSTDTFRSSLGLTDEALSHRFSGW